MPQIKLSELPDDLRVKLTEEGTEELWHRVEEFGGIKSLSGSFEFSQSKMYNWKNKELALPVNFARRLMGQNSTDEIVLLKGKGSSGAIKKPVFPLNFSRELLTRIRYSVKVNSDGTPVYITESPSLAARFSHILQEIGEIENERYSRHSRIEIRYPKFVHDLAKTMDFEEDFAALFDEQGSFKGDKMVAGGRSVKIEDFTGKLYSDEKAYRLAVKQENGERLREIISNQQSRVNQAF